MKPDESRTIDIAVADVPERAELSDAACRPRSSQAVMSGLRTLHAYRSARARHG